MSTIALLPLVLAAAPAHGDTLTIRLANDHPREVATAELLQEVFASHDLRDWVITREVLIDKDQIPHSHPVLTLHTRHLEEPANLLSTFLHEQFHWWVQDREEALAAAVEAFRTLWPDVPSRENGGARDEYSTYLHLVVCDLEYQATTLLIGEQAARAAIEAFGHYGWIYERVLDDPRVRETLAAHGFILS